MPVRGTARDPPGSTEASTPTPARQRGFLLTPPASLLPPSPVTKGPSPCHADPLPMTPTPAQRRGSLLTPPSSRLTAFPSPVTKGPSPCHPSPCHPRCSSMQSKRSTMAFRVLMRKRVAATACFSSMSTAICISSSKNLPISLLLIAESILLKTSIT